MSKTAGTEVAGSIEKHHVVAGLVEILVNGIDIPRENIVSVLVVTYYLDLEVVKIDVAGCLGRFYSMVKNIPEDFTYTVNFIVPLHGSRKIYKIDEKARVFGAPPYVIFFHF